MKMKKFLTVIGLTLMLVSGVSATAEAGQGDVRPGTVSISTNQVDVRP